MKNIITSASKMVFVGMAIAAIGGFFIGKLSQENFMILCGGAFTFYFAHKGESGPPTGPTPLFAGK